MSRNEERIDNLCKTMGFEPKVVYDLTKILLEHYRNGFETSELFQFNLDVNGIINQKASMRSDFLEAIHLPMEESAELQDRLFQNLRDCPWMRPLINLVLEEIAEKVEDGALYKRIIENYYLKANPMSNEEMADAENMSLASVERKKREAIKCFGISMYRYAYRRECEERGKENNG